MRTWCAVLLLAGAASAVTAQDVFDASAFDQTVQESTQAEQKAKLETQFGGNLLYDTSGTTTADFSGYGVSGTFSGKAFTKVTVPDYGALYLAYNFYKNLYQGAVGGFSDVPVPDLDLYSVGYDLAEFYVSMDLGRVVYLRIGNQLLAWGPSIIWTPVDFVNLQKANPLSALDLRVGKPGIRTTVPLGNSNLFFFADMSGTVTPTGAGGDLVVNDPVRSTNLAGRFDVTVSGFELGFTTFVGSSIQNQAGFDFSGRVLGFDVYGEFAAGLPLGVHDFTYSTSLGFQKTLGELSYWNVAGEFFFNEAGTSDTSTYSSLVASNDFSPFYVGKYYAYAAVTRTHLFIDGVSSTLAGFMDISDTSFLVRLSTTVRVPGVPPFTFNLGWAGGGEGKAFTFFSGNNALTAGLQVRVEF